MEVPVLPPSNIRGNRGRERSETWEEKWGRAVPLVSRTPPRATTLHAQCGGGVLGCLVFVHEKSGETLFIQEVPPSSATNRLAGIFVLQSLAGQMKRLRGLWHSEMQPKRCASQGAQRSRSPSNPITPISNPCLILIKSCSLYPGFSSAVSVDVPEPSPPGANGRLNE